MFCFRKHHKPVSIERSLARLIWRFENFKEFIMATSAQLQESLDGFKQEVTDYVAKRDAIDVDLKAQLDAALANAGVSADEQAAIDKAFQTAEDAKAMLAPPAAPAVTNG